MTEAAGRTEHADHRIAPASRSQDPRGPRRRRRPHVPAEGCEDRGPRRGGPRLDDALPGVREPPAEPLEVLYTLPLPADGAVLGYTMRLGERTITGSDREARGRAREVPQGPRGRARRGPARAGPGGHVHPAARQPSARRPGPGGDRGPAPAGLPGRGGGGRAALGVPIPDRRRRPLRGSGRARSRRGPPGRGPRGRRRHPGAARDRAGHRGRGARTHRAAFSSHELAVSSQEGTTRVALASPSRLDRDVVVRWRAAGRRGRSPPRRGAWARRGRRPLRGRHPDPASRAGRDVRAGRDDPRRRERLDERGADPAGQADRGGAGRFLEAGGSLRDPGVRRHGHAADAGLGPGHRERDPRGRGPSSRAAGLRRDGDEGSDPARARAAPFRGAAAGGADHRRRGRLRARGRGPGDSGSSPPARGSTSSASAALPTAP